MRHLQWIVLGLVWIIQAPTANAQNTFDFKFIGTCYTTNRQGEAVRTLLTHNTLLREEARRLGRSDFSNLALVYRIRGSQFGDTVDLVRKDTGEVLSSVFGFFFGADASLLRDFIMNAAGTEEKRLDYLYTRQNSHSMGAAFVTRTGTDLRAVSDDFRVRGEMHYIVTSEGGWSQKVCEGRFLVRGLVHLGP